MSNLALKLKLSMLPEIPSAAYGRKHEQNRMSWSSGFCLRYCGVKNPFAPVAMTHRRQPPLTMTVKRPRLKPELQHPRGSASSVVLPCPLRRFTIFAACKGING